MNKIMTKLSGLFLGLAMMVGVGAGISTHTVSEAKAGSTTVDIISAAGLTTSVTLNADNNPYQMGDTPITLTGIKGTSNFPALNCNPTNGVDLRFYKGTTCGVTFEADGYSITKIEFLKNESTASTLGASFSVNCGTLTNNVWEGEATSITLSYSADATFKEQMYIINVTYGSSSAPSATLTSNKESYNVGDSFSISANFNEYCTGSTSVSLISKDEEKVFNTSYTNIGFTGNFRLAGEVTFEAYNDSTVVGTLTISVGLSDDLKAITKVPNIGGYKKVTTSPTDWSGEYLLVYEDGTTAYVATGVDGTGGSAYKAATINDNNISAKPTDAASILIESMTGGGYSIKMKGGGNNGKYITSSTNANGIAFGTTATKMTLSYSSNTVLIKNDGGAVLRFNSATNEMRFRFFKSSTYTGQKAVQLYKLSAGEGFSYKEQSVSPSLYNFVRQVYTCDSNGSSEISNWDDAKSLYATLCDNGGLDNTDKTILKTCVTNDPDDKTKATFSLLSNFITKYDRYVCEYLESDQLTTIDYLERFTTEGAGDRSLNYRISLLNNLIFESNSSTWIIAVISVVGLSAIGGYFFYRKRKENI